MSLSAYAIGGKVWIVRTDELAQSEVPKTLPIGSVILTPQEAQRLSEQLTKAGASAYHAEMQRLRRERR